MKKITLLLLIIAMIYAGCDFSAEQEEKEQTGQPPVSHVEHPDWSKNANIYEVNLRQYTEQGTIKAFMKQHLPRLKNMGVDILWFMPIHPIGEENRKGSLGSYYSVKDFTAVNPEFGTLADFKAMVNLAHELDMKVILDWVANHTAWDHAWVTEHPGWYDKDTTGSMYAPHGWSDVVQLDYDNQALRRAMIGEMEFWVREADIDGYRCDVAGMVPTDFWDSARVALDRIKPVFMLAEAEEEELLIHAFDMDYGWHFHHLSNEMGAGDTSAKVVPAYFDKLEHTFPVGSYKMNFTSNHDENTWNGTVFERYGEGYQTFAVLMATVPGMPLIYTGQEAANRDRLEFFEKDIVDWKDYPLESFYRSLLNLKKRNKALWNGEYGGHYQQIQNNNAEKVLTFIREKEGQSVLVILNLSGDNIEVQMTGNNFAGEYIDVFNDSEVTFMENHQLKLNPWEYRVYEK
ncbi:MAG: alpha-amylase family glycosyl hydrolase [Bacteroidales bacterium]